MAMCYALIGIICLTAVKGGVTEFMGRSAIPTHPPLTDDEILEITGYGKGLIRKLIESYLFDANDKETSQSKRDTYMNDLKEQIKYLNCVFEPCLYGGRCELVDLDARFVTMEFGVDLGVFKDDPIPESQTVVGDASGMGGNPSDQQIAILRSLEDYIYRIERSHESKAAFISEHASSFVRCICRSSAHEGGRCQGCSGEWVQPM